ncbi:hypothetical protein HGO37_23775 [Rhizobium sp. CG4]|uniref:hypothetical protein n=1 Tax=Rhizobium/Agrobacterium group TaxID=227290 RepID=UPI002033CDDA|nr:hypothetical protein [Rhizobium sp. CG4]MCM2458418.1 hypothetical protein [Rhizobium sp. CG4]
MIAMKQMRWGGAALLALSFACAGILPAWTGYENGPIENAQVLILLGGAVVAMVFAADQQSTLRWFWLAVIPLWIVMALRELSWGGVFMPALSVSEHGPYFSSSQLWYRSYIVPMLVAVSLLVAVLFIKAKGPHILKYLVTTRQLPYADIVLVILSMIISAGAEGHMGLNFGEWGHMLVLEEMSETAAYVFLLSAQARVRLALRHYSPN